MLEIEKSQEPSFDPRDFPDLMGHSVGHQRNLQGTRAVVSKNILVNRRVILYRSTNKQYNFMKRI
jgi:hypothetical protein